MSPAVRSAMSTLTDCIIEAESVGDAFCDAVDAASGNPPAWIHAYRMQVRRIQGAAEVLESLLWGDGGCAPHSDQVDACPVDGRGMGSTLPGSDSRPEKPSSSALN